ncbi:MAG: DUF4115 domain-containing protein [Anaerolineae bacterium]
MTEDTARPLGEWLRQRREELDLSLEQVGEHTRIRVRYLEALEAEDFDVLPDVLVGRGFLRNYAAYLELDLQEALARYSEKVAPPEPELLPVAGPSPFTSEPFRPVPLHKMPGEGVPRGLLIGLLVILVAALSLLTWWRYPLLRDLLAREKPTVVGAFTTPTERTEDTDLPMATRTSTATPLATSLPATALATEAASTLGLTLTPTSTPLPSLTPTLPIYTGIFLELVLTDTSWVQISVDGVRQFQGELEADTYKSWYGEERIELRIGNAGGVLVTVNGQNLGTLGGSGEVVDRVFEIVDEQLTEATVIPELTGTVTVTITPPTATRSPSAVPTEAVTPSATISPTVPSTSTASP